MVDPTTSALRSENAAGRVASGRGRVAALQQLGANHDRRLTSHNTFDQRRGGPSEAPVDEQSSLIVTLRVERIAEEISRMRFVGRP